MARGWRGVLVALGAVAWAFVVYFNYYVTHKPFTLPVAVGLLDSLGNLAVLALGLVGKGAEKHFGGP
jgi:hypothetical protein